MWNPFNELLIFCLLLDWSLIYFSDLLRNLLDNGDSLKHFGKGMFLEDLPPHYKYLNLQLLRIYLQSVLSWGMSTSQVLLFNRITNVTNKYSPLESLISLVAIITDWFRLRITPKWNGASLCMKSVANMSALFITMKIVNEEDGAKNQISNLICIS